MWIISWRFNGKSYIRKYKTYKEAEVNLNYLSMHKLDPTLHYKEAENEKPKTIR